MISRTTTARIYERRRENFPGVGVCKTKETLKQIRRTENCLRNLLRNIKDKMQKQNVLFITSDYGLLSLTSFSTWPEH
jgi:hypothetical protein